MTRKPTTEIDGVAESTGRPDKVKAAGLLDALRARLSDLADGLVGRGRSRPSVLSVHTDARRIARAVGEGHAGDASRLDGLLNGFEGLTFDQQTVLAREAIGVIERIRASLPAETEGPGSTAGPQESPEKPKDPSPVSRVGDRDLDTDVQYAKGIGPKRAQMLGKLGIKTIRDALYYFPFRYEDRSSLNRISRVHYGAVETVSGEVVAAEVVSTRSRRFKIFELTIRDETGFITGVWFNQPYLEKHFKVGDTVVLTGTVKPDQYHGSRTVMDNPEYEVVTGGEDDAVHTGRIVPIYRLSAGVGQRGLRSMMKRLVDVYATGLEDFLPDGFHERYKIPVLPDAVREAHFPDSETDIETLNRLQSRAHKRLVFDEFFILQLGLAMMKHGRVEAASGVSMSGGEGLMDEYLKSLPFEPTGAQKKVIGEIADDMRSGKPMNRLVQGDVGCGKTVVAVSAICMAIGSGYQAALMAPTEILAEQHYLNIKEPLENLGVRTALVTSSLTKKRREEALAAVADGSAGLAVGTHSLIQGDVGFKKLGLAVIDEQHRFGVMQRAVLRDKGESPDVLVMTATPIPRTLALTVYGDLDVSVIDELPPGRTPVTTRLFDENNRSEAYRKVLSELEAGRQAYIVYPLVEESEKSDLKAAKEGAEELAAGVFKKYRVGLLHGKMKPAQKDEVMTGFRAGEIDVLVATTVIEVGVDVPNATAMLIEHAERFGLAQLHQLRGRVGRGAHRSYCIMVSAGFTESSRDRLGAMLKSPDGFVIAEEDLRIRGPGEFFGTRQSGMPDLALGNVIRDARIIEAARKEAFGIIEKDPRLDAPGHGILKKAVMKKWSERLRIANVG